MDEPKPLDAVWEALADMGKLEAIKVYHKETGLDLKTCERVKRLTGWRWIADTLHQLPQDHAA